jgi:hypothetical protein
MFAFSSSILSCSLYFSAPVFSSRLFPSLFSSVPFSLLVCSSFSSLFSAVLFIYFLLSSRLLSYLLFSSAFFFCALQFISLLLYSRLFSNLLFLSSLLSSLIFFYSPLFSVRTNSAVSAPRHLSIFL